MEGLRPPPAEDPGAGIGPTDGSSADPLPSEALRIYKLIFHGTRDIILFMKMDGMIIEANEAAFQSYGYSRDELLRLSVQDLRAPSTRSTVTQDMVRASAEGVLFETIHRRKDGSLFPVEVSSRSIDISGEHALLSVIRDISRRKRAEEDRERLWAEGRRKAAEMQSILDNMLDAVVVCDSQARITLMNRTALKMLGTEAVRKLELTPNGADFLEFRHLDGRLYRVDELPMYRALAGEVAILDDITALLPTTGKRVQLWMSASPIRQDDGTVDGAVLVARDVSEMVELEQLKDQFAAVAAHELKTPVTIMKGYAQLLQKRLKELPPDRLEALEAITRGADRIDRIVTDLLDISQLHVGRMRLTRESIDLTELVQQVVNGMASSAPDHRLQVMAQGPVVLPADAERLTQVIGNLVENAIRYSPHGGPVDVTVSGQEGKAVVSVRDEGLGIPREKQARIFQHFYRAHAGTPHDYGGMGVGLFISREIVNRHGGEIWFESTEGSGSTFSFSVPLELPGGVRE